MRGDEELNVRRLVVGFAAVALLITGVVVANVPAHAGLPANKPFAAAAVTEKHGPGTFPLLTSTVRNSKPTDLVLAVSMECAILTDAVIPGSGMPGTTQNATTSGSVRAWITIDGVIVPVVSSSQPPQNPPAAGGDK